MDFGAGAVSHKQASPNATAENKAHGSANLKHQRSGLGDDNWGLPKMPKPGGPDFSSKMTMMTTAESSSTFGRSNLWPDDGQKMLSFSSSGPGGGGGSSRNITFSLAQDEQDKTAMNEGVIHAPFARMRGPFTPSQWMELEHQALIYKHLVAKVPVPPHLLVPLRRSLPSYASPASYAPNFLGWGCGFQVGYSGSSNDPEPGRCRRTDGKKWRCSRDAVPDQKYCERHINRGRHRSRKPVEGHTGHAVAGSTASKVAPIAPASSSGASVIPSRSGSPNALTAMQQQFSSMHPDHTSATAASTNINLGSRSQGFQSLSLLHSPTASLKCKDASPYATPKQHLPIEESSISEFGLVLSDALLNPSQRLPYLDNCNSGSFLQFDGKEANNQHLVHQFIDDWPKDQSDRHSAPWPEELKSDWTQLSMSIPGPNFSSSTSSPVQEKSTISIPRLLHDLDLPIHMSLGTNHDLGGSIHKQPSWLPVTWGNLIGGPLGEVLISSTTTAGLGENLSTMKATWKNNSPQMESSPSGVLQKSNFASLSNSSSGSSPPSADDKSVAEKAHLCNEFLGAALAESTAISLQ